MSTAYQMKLKTLRRALWGSYGVIANECGVAISTVSRVLNGDFVNTDVLDKAVEVRDRIKAQKEAELNKLADRL